MHARLIALTLAVVAVAYLVWANKEWMFSPFSECGHTPPAATNMRNTYSMGHMVPTGVYPLARPNPPHNADPRVINPSLAAAPVQVPHIQTFGAFGVSDSVASVFGVDMEYDMDMEDMEHDTEHFTIPMRNLAPEPNVTDLVEDGLSSLPAGPVELVDAKLTPPGMARPMSEWAWINYGSQ